MNLSDWAALFLGNTVIIGILAVIVQRYTVALIENRIKPLTAEEILRRQNFLNSRLEAYTKACDLICLSLAAKEWTGPEVPKNRIVEPNDISESEINSCAARLAMFSDNSDVRKSYLKCFQNASAQDLGTFVNLLRKDLGYGESKFKPEEYPYIFGRQSEIQQVVQPDR